MLQSADTGDSFHTHQHLHKNYTMKTAEPGTSHDLTETIFSTPSLTLGMKLKNGSWEYTAFSISRK